MTDNKWLTFDQAADTVNEHFNLKTDTDSGIGRNTIYEWVKKGELKAVKIGRRRRIDRDYLLQYLVEKGTYGAS